MPQISIRGKEMPESPIRKLAPLAEKAKEKGITEVVFDRGGFIYQGKIKALADAAREAGLNF